MEFPGGVGEALAELHGINPGGEIRISSAVTVENMDLCDVCPCRKWILIDSEANGVGKVRAIVAKELEDALSNGSSRNRLSSLQRGVWNKGAAMTEGCRVALSKEWRRASYCGTCDKVSYAKSGLDVTMVWVPAKSSGVV